MGLTSETHGEDWVKWKTQKTIPKTKAKHSEFYWINIQNDFSTLC